MNNYMGGTEDHFQFPSNFQSPQCSSFSTTKAGYSKITFPIQKGEEL